MGRYRPSIARHAAQIKLGFLKFMKYKLKFNIYRKFNFTKTDITFTYEVQSTRFSKRWIRIEITEILTLVSSQSETVSEKVKNLKMSSETDKNSHNTKTGLATVVHRV